MSSGSGAERGLRRLRRGELITLIGVVLIVVSLFVPTYDSPSGQLTAWDTFGAAVALELAGMFAGLALAGTLGILVGAWETMRDEHTSLYHPVSPPPQPRP